MKTVTIHFPQDEGKLYKQFRYPGGEVQVRLLFETCRILDDAKKVYVYASVTDGEVVALAQLLTAITVRGISPILIMPYLPYARADRRFVEGDGSGLWTYIKLLKAAGCNHLVTLDVHSSVAHSTCRLENIEFTNVKPACFVETVVSALDNPIILLPDAGASLRYCYANSLFCCKKRNPESGKLSDFSVPPKKSFEGYKSVLIVDDICDGGRTFVGIAEAMKSYGLDLYLYTTHGIFSNGFGELNKYFKHIYATDSFPRRFGNLVEPNLTVIPCEGVIRANIMTNSELWNAVCD